MTYRVVILKRMTYAVEAETLEEASAQALVAARGNLTGSGATMTRIVRVVPEIEAAEEVSEGDYERFLADPAAALRWGRNPHTAELRLEPER